MNITISKLKNKFSLSTRTKGNRNNKSWLLTNSHILFFYSILTSALLVRIANLNYNTAFNDEAIYIVIGRMGLFTSDWWSYGAKLWMAGIPYIYPPLSALAYQTGGLVASRFLNVIFGVILVEEVYRLTILLNIFDEKTNKKAALIASFLAAFSAAGIFVSKLATYDMPSFLLFIAAINSFLKAKYFQNGKYYFLSFIFMFLAFLTKIVIAIFFPILIPMAFLAIKGRQKVHKKLALTYLVIPFLLSFVVYIFTYQEYLMTYVTTHKDLGQAESYMDILSLTWREASLLLLFLLPATIAFIKSKKIQFFAALLALSAVVPIFHLSLNRYATLDKHLYLTIIFLSVIAGYTISLATKSNAKYARTMSLAILPVITLLYLLNANKSLHEMENGWENTAKLQNYLQNEIKPGDKILTEEGGVVILALYDKIFPPKNIVTFDWIDYSGLSGDRGYTQAVKDSYFDYIEIDNETVGDNSLKNKIRQDLGTNYSLALQQDTFEVYKKNEQ